MKMDFRSEFIGDDIVNNYFNVQNLEGSDICAPDVAQNGDKRRDRDYLDSTLSLSQRRCEASVNKNHADQEQNSLLNSISKGHHNCKGLIMLLGPAKCGKTSLCMECASSVASTGSNNKRVSLLVHFRRKRKQFPLISRPRQNDGKDRRRRRRRIPTEEDAHKAASALFLERMNALEREEQQAIRNKLAPKSCQQFETNDCPEATRKNRHEALQKINIHYLSSVDDLIRYLAAVPLLPMNLRPSGGIIIEDLHLFFMDNNPPNVPTSVMTDEKMMKLLQLFALLTSSANYLNSHRARRNNELLFVSSWDPSMVTLPLNLKCMISNYLSILNITPTTNRVTDNINFNFEWKISLESAKDDASGKVNQCENEDEVVATYIVQTCETFNSGENRNECNKELIWSLETISVTPI